LQDLGREPESARGISFRSILTGMVLSALLGIATPYSNLVVSGSPMSFDYSTPAAIFFFFLFMILVVPLLSWLRQTWGFNQAELATVYIMGMVACTLPTNGLVEMLLPTLSGGSYYATPENDWANGILAHIKPWLVVSDEEAIKGFYEGIPKGERIPWGVWARALGAWTPLLFGLYGASIAMMSLLRKQWIVSERLTFPLVQVPIAMIRDEGAVPKGRIGPFFRNPVMWAGLLVPIVLNSHWGLHYHFPATIPQAFPLWKYIRFWGGAFFIRLGISYAVVGFGYLLSTKVSFSIWVLGLFTTLEYAVFTRLGISSTRQVSFSALGSAHLTHQGFGAMLALVALFLWRARKHLGGAVRNALKGGRQISDSEEILSYRQAVALLVGSTVTMTLWLSLSGMDWWVALLMVSLSFIIMVGLTRIVAQGGLSVTRSPLLASDAIITGVGSAALGPGNLAAMGMALPWSGEYRTTVMAAVMHGLKLAENYVVAHRRRLVFAVSLAIVTAVCTAAVMILSLSYRYGGINLSRWMFGSHAYDFMDRHISAPQGISWDCWWATGAGVVIQFLLTFAHQRLIWWPIHPVVFPVSAIWSTHHLMVSIFIAWATKSAVLKYGGAKWYRRTLPFFLGMILGQYVSGGSWIVIDALTGTTGNYLFFW